MRISVNTWHFSEDNSRALGKGRKGEDLWRKQRECIKALDTTEIGSAVACYLVIMIRCERILYHNCCMHSYIKVLYREI